MSSSKTDCPAVSVCIANYNGINIIDACIDSVLTQDFPQPVEIIIHDDASTDGSVPHIRARYPELQLIESPDNVGFCIANNRMAALARGAYLLLLNNDAQLLPDALQTLFSAAQTMNKPAILGLPQYGMESGKLIDRGSLLDPFFNAVPNLDSSRHGVAMIAGACLWMPRRLWNDFGGFPEWFGSIGEDLYLCCRARLAGCLVRTLPASGYRHRVGTSFGGGKIRDGRLVTTYRRRALSERNRTMVMAMSCPGLSLPLLLPLHLLLLLLEGTLLAVLLGNIRNVSGIYFPVFQSLWKNRKRLLAERKKFMGQRKVSSLEFFSTFQITPYKLRMLLKYGLPRLRQS